MGPSEGVTSWTWGHYSHVPQLWGPSKDGLGLAGVRGPQGQQRGRLRHSRASKVGSRLGKLEQGCLMIQERKSPSLTPHQHCFKHLPHLLQEFHQEKAWLLTMCSELSYQRRNPGLEKIIEGNGYALRHVKGLSLNSSSATHAVNVLSSPTSVSSSVKWGYHFLPCRVEKLYFMKNAN